MQAVEPAEVAAPFAPPFRGRAAKEILQELGFPDTEPASLVRRLAFAVEIGDYPYITGLLHQEQAGANDDSAVAKALARFLECAERAEHYEEARGASSAKNFSHRFWSDVWERDNRLRAQGYRLFGEPPRQTTHPGAPKPG